MTPDIHIIVRRGSLYATVHPNNQPAKDWLRQKGVGFMFGMLYMHDLIAAIDRAGLQLRLTELTS